MEREKKEKLEYIAEKKISELKEVSYREIKEKYLNNPQTEEYRETDKIYQIEIDAFYDDGIGKSPDIRISVSVDDGTLLRGIFPVSSDFIKKFKE